MPLLTYPNGQVVDVHFDEQAHSYVVAHKFPNGQFSDFRPIHGCTTPLDTVPKPYLKPWAAKEACHATLQYLHDHPEIIDQIPQLFQDMQDMDDRVLDDKGKLKMSYYRFRKLYGWLAPLKKAHETSSTEGKELGTWIHKAIEDYYKTDRTKLPIITPDVAGMWESFIQFDNFFKPKHDGLEFMVYSLMFVYSGQGDFKGNISGKYCILDWKSTNRSSANPEGISVEYFFQLGGLAQAEWERTGKWVDDLAAVNFDKKGGEPKLVWASDFGASPQDCARAYVSCHNNHHMIENWDYKFRRR